MYKRLQGKTALVTGGTRGIGAAIAKRFAQEGADVAITYAASSAKADVLVKELESYGVAAFAVKADQSDVAQSAGAVKTVAERFGKLDILVNNAGVFVTGAVNDTGTEAFDRLFAVNVTGVSAAVRSAIPFLPEGGRIITIGSVAADRLPFAGAADYGATKAAVAAYARGWARDLGPKGITVNVVQPGPIDTDMNPDNTDFAASLKAGTALGRYGKAEEVAAAVAFLASPDASYITGTTLDVDGGINA